MDELDGLLQQPTEGRNLEIKSWIDPATADGKQKLVKAAFALRNVNGGYLVIGYDDKTLKPVTAGAPADPCSMFHPDTIQDLISRYAQKPFEISVHYSDQDGTIIPVIKIPSGVLAPVVVRRPLMDATNNKELLSTGDIYFRTLLANGLISSAQIQPNDWPDLLDICFDNREADIGRFVRRHLVGISPATLRAALSGIAQEEADPAELLKKELCGLLDKGRGRFSAMVRERDLQLPQHGSWEVGLIIRGEFPAQSPTIDFVRRLDAANPQLTGWPVWLESTSFTNPEHRPISTGGGFEALIVAIDDGWGGRHLDFMRKDPKGRFYLYRALQDDLSTSDGAPQPMTALDFGLAILRTAEALAVGIAFGRAMGCDVQETNLEFAFRWGGLKGRQISSWANPERFLGPVQEPAYDDSFCITISMPLDTPNSSLWLYTHEVVASLFALFGGEEIPPQVVEELVHRLMTRTLRG